MNKISENKKKIKFSSQKEGRLIYKIWKNNVTFVISDVVKYKCSKKVENGKQNFKIIGFLDFLYNPKF
jgi:hypothetical protein